MKSDFDYLKFYDALKALEKGKSLTLKGTIEEATKTRSLIHTFFGQTGLGPYFSVNRKGGVIQVTLKEEVINDYKKEFPAIGTKPPLLTTHLEYAKTLPLPQDYLFWLYQKDFITLLELGVLTCQLQES